MMFRMIAWDRDKLTKLRNAAEEAVLFGKQTFTVDLDRKHKDVPFNTAEALAYAAQLETDFAENPTPVFPPNNEGSEP